MVVDSTTPRKRGLLSYIEKSHSDLWGSDTPQSGQKSARQAQRQLIQEIKEKVVEMAKRLDRSVDWTDEKAHHNLRELIDMALEERGHHVLPAQRREIIDQVINEITGFGPLEPLLDDPSITEIMVNNHKTVFVEQNGRLQKVDVEFNDGDHVRQVIERIISPLGRRIDESSPMVDARLPDGSRVNAIIPPLAIDGPSLTIRKFPEQRLSASDLVQMGSITPKMVDFLSACIRGKRNVVISGGTSSGKTTILNMFSNYIPLGERLVTIEDSAELRLAHQMGGNLIRLETKPPNLEGKGEVTIRDLVRNALRMRPDRIIVGECRGGEALDMLQAMNTGHEGSLTTIHANNPEQAITRLEALVLMGATDMPHAIVRESIAEAIHLIVQAARLQDGSRKITHVTEVVGYDRESGRVRFNPLFSFRQTGVDASGKVVGKFVSHGNAPRFAKELKSQGIMLDMSIFKGGEV